MVKKLFQLKFYDGKVCIFSVFLIFSLLFIPLILYSGVPHMINFQGRLLENGSPVDDNREMIFTVWDQETL